MKKLLSFLLIFTLTFLVLPANFSFAQEDEHSLDSYLAVDIEDHWGSDILSDFVMAGIIKGYLVNGEVQVLPDKNITRAEVIALIVRALELENDGTAIAFTDVPEGHWATSEINAASANGIIQGNGSENVFPNENIKRDELAAMIVRAFEATVDFEDGTPVTFNDVPTDYWGTDYINQASQVGIIEGYLNNFSPSNKATRAETVTMLFRSLNLEVSNLTSDEDLVNRLLDSENTSYNLLESGNYELLLDHNKAFYTGFQRAFANESVEYLLNFESESEGLDFTIELTEPLAAEVPYSTDRFAVVEVTAGAAKVTVEYGSTVITNEQSLAGAYFMRKINNEWMIYFSDVELVLQ